MLYFKIRYFLSVQIFSICDATLRHLPEFLSLKSGILEKFCIIDFLENKMIFSQTKYAVTYFSLRPTKLLDISEIDFQLLPPYVWLLVTFAFKFHLPCGLFLTCIFDIYFHEFVDHPGKE